MSYILEALKKVEQKRVQEESSGSLALLGAPLAEPPKRPLWPYPVIAALLLNAGVMIWWIRPWKAEKKPPSAQPYAVQPTNLPPPILAGQNRPNRAIDKKEGVPKRGAAGPPAETVKKEARTVTPPKAERPPATVKPPAESQPRVSLKKEAPPSGKIFEFNDLPPDLKSTLPEFKVSAHVYNTDRHNRMVRVNDKILQEGEELSPGLKVDEIIPGGIIFSYQGYRFRFRF